MFPTLTSSPLPTLVLLLLSLQTLLVTAGPAMLALRVGSAIGSAVSSSKDKNSKKQRSLLEGLSPVEKRIVARLVSDEGFVRAVRDARDAREMGRGVWEREAEAYSLYERESEPEMEMVGIWERDAEADAEADAEGEMEISW